MLEKTVNFLIADEHWPALFARASHKGVEALQRSGVDFSSIESRFLRVVGVPTENGLVTGWSVVLIGHA